MASNEEGTTGNLGKSHYRHDPLTGLPNRISFIEELEALMQQAKVTSDSFALFMIDMGNLIRIRDTLGYKTSEHYIEQVARKLQRLCETTTCLYRFDSLRFGMIIRGTKSLVEYRIIIGELFGRFGHSETVGSYELSADLSIGVSIYRGQKDVEELIRHAENALFQAKAKGQRYEFYSSDLDVQSYKHFILRNDLETAVDKNQFRVHYQPLVNLSNYEILAVEALIRWEHPHWGLIMPEEFVSLAEETGSIVAIGRWLLREVCRTYKQWLNKGFAQIKVAVNFSSVQLFESNLVEKTKDMINEYDLDPDFLIIELTESILIEPVDKVISTINALQSLGIQIALDDFGTGYSSLAYLNSLHIDILKIDGPFIKDVAVNRTSQILIKHVIELANQLGIKLVAKQIETEEQLSYLRHRKCYAGQGFLFSHPLPVEEFERVLATGICQPMLAGHREFPGERRKSFRIKLVHFLEADLTVLEIGGKKVKIGNTQVLVKNLGPGGLCFVSDIRLPLARGIILQFTTQLLGEEIKMYGSTVWTYEVGENMFEYGLEFKMTENKKTDLVKILNQILVEMRKETLFSDGRFVAGSPEEYFH